jgi:RNA-directed DNA polymerase
VGEAKPFNIPKRVVWKAFKRVKANQGAAGVDKQSIAGFEADLSNNLYKLWNRMCSGSYFPPPVRRVEIPKADGGMRPLGIPTVADRIAQEVARRYLEPRLEPVFHTDSYGYRPGRSAIDAVRTARQRCWRADWVLDIDVKGYFDSIDWELLLKAVRRHTDCPWVLLYIERLAGGAGADRGRQRRAADSGNAARWGHGSSNAIDNFRFERTIVGWRGCCIVDLRRKG